MMITQVIIEKNTPKTSTDFYSFPVLLTSSASHFS